LFPVENETDPTPPTPIPSEEGEEETNGEGD
jgi:hypothetical protein